MKKTIASIALVLSGLVSQAQDIKVQSHAGITTAFKSDYTQGLAPTTFLGIEFYDKVGIEYGYSWSLNNNPNDLMNYIYGNTNSYTAGHFTHFISAYYITNRDEGTAFVAGPGLALANVYKAENRAIIETYYHPYLKVGLDQKFGSRWNGQFNFILGNTVGITFGLKKTL